MNIDKRYLTECWFYLREPSADHPGKYKYTSLHQEVPMGALGPLLPQPPLIGDTFPIHDREKGIQGRFLVVARHWEQISYGSPNWPYGESVPTVPRILTVLVEPAPDMYADEAPLDEDDDE